MQGASLEKGKAAPFGICETSASSIVTLYTDQISLCSLALRCQHTTFRRFLSTVSTRKLEKSGRFNSADP